MECLVGGEIRDEDGLTRGDHASAQALAHLDPRRHHDGGGGQRARGDHEVVPFQEPDARRLHAQEVQGLVDETREHALAVAGGGEPAGDLVEHVEAATLALRLLEEADVPQETRGLRGHALQKPQLALAQPPALTPPHEVEGPRHLVVHDEGEDESGLVFEATEELVAEARVRGHVVRHDGPALAPDRGMEALLLERERSGKQGGQEIWRNLVTGQGYDLIRACVV